MQFKIGVSFILIVSMNEISHVFFHSDISHIQQSYVLK